ncbi:MAG TPA: hydroxyacid dehydrogenase [Clostridia bacterium]|nr:hydroxyacid dehydrogenase [Clostridia bacterium]
MHDKKIIVLDDDPTGTQTVYGLPVYTKVDQEEIKEIFLDNNIKAFYILTNTRSMPEEEVIALDSYLAKIIDAASQSTGVDYEIILRGDSTLRGHFPLELDVIRDHISKKIDGYFLIPFFAEGGRITIDDIHYVREKDKLIPVGETQYARDHTFGFTSSNLKDYVEEKSKKKILRDEVVSISLGELRSQSPEVLDKIINLNGRVCIVNAENYSDLEAFVRELKKAEALGKNYLLRTAASYVKARIGLEDRPLLDGHVLAIDSKRGGVIFVGSYINKTTQQVNHTLRETGVDSLEIDVSLIIKQEDNEAYLEEISKKIDENIAHGIDTLVYTSRQLVLGNEHTSSLEIGNRISDFVTKIVRAIKEPPAFIIAKGGITSSDIATKGLKVRKATVCGQIAKGIPVWQCGPESKFNGLVYVVFPGNVGDESELTNVLHKLRCRGADDQ